MLASAGTVGRFTLVRFARLAASICRATTIIARTDAPETVAFLGCVRAAPTSEAVETCGCTEVTGKWLCPAAL
jgi:hypothetical protein